MLSDQAQRRRREYMVGIHNRVAVQQYLRIIAVGVLLLAEYFMRKLTPAQRFALIAITLIASGVLAHMFAKSGNVAFVGLIMFVLGVLLAEIRHLR